MEMKTRKPIQILTVALALTMLAAYVVYSQRQRAQNAGQRSLTVAPSSKLRAPLISVSPNGQAEQTDAVPAKPSELFAPGSKSLAPVLDIRPAAVAVETNASPRKLSSHTVFPGSKSAPVFDLEQTLQQQKSEVAGQNSKGEGRK